MRVQRGERRGVGVIRLPDRRAPPSIRTPDSSALELGQVERLRAMRANRDPAAVESALGTLRETSRAYAFPTASQPPLMPLIIDAVRTRATVGEIADALRSSWSEYRPA